MRLLFVCLGNICRSPTAEAVMRAIAERDGLDTLLTVDSAGTGDWNLGRPPDPRAAAAAARRGLVLTGRARQVRARDFTDFDLLLAADRANVRDLRAVAPSAEGAERIALLRSFDPRSVAAGELEVPDPYHGGDEGFEEVLDLIERSCAGLVTQLLADGRLAPVRR